MRDDKFLLILMAALAFVSFLILKPFLTYVLFSIILTVVAYPLYEKLKTKVRFAPAAAILVIVLIILVVVVPSIYLTITTFVQARDIITNIGTVDFSNLKQLESKLEIAFDTDLNFAETIRVWILDLSSTIRSLVIGNIINFTRTVVNFLAGIALMFFVMFYLFIDGKQLVVQIKKELPIDEKYKDHLFNKTFQTIQGLFLGLFLTAIIQGALAAVGYFLFGVHNIVLLAFLTGIFSLIPFLGAPVIYIPVALYLLFQGNMLGGVGLFLYGAIVISNIDNIVRPRVVRFKSNIHPLNVILGFVGGTVIFGFSGIVIGPLILSLFQEVLDVYSLSRNKNKR